MAAQIDAAGRKEAARVLPWDKSSPNPIVANGVLFASGNLFPLVNDYAVLIADSAADGSRLWTSQTTDAQYGDPIVANGIVYALAVGSHLDAFHIPPG